MQPKINTLKFPQYYDREKCFYACFTIIDLTPIRKLIIEFKDQNYHALNVKNALGDTQAIALRDWLIEMFPLKDFPIPTPAQSPKR